MKKRRLLRAGFLAGIGAVAALVALAAGAQARSHAGTITIGVVGGQSGLYAYVGNEQYVGAQIAADQINAAGGVIGSKIQIVARDDAGDPTKGINAVQELVSQQNAVAIVGSPDTAGAIAPFAERVQRPVIGVVDGGGPNVHPNGPTKAPRKWVFGITMDTFAMAQKLGQYAAAHCKKIAILHDTTTYGVPAAAATVGELARLKTKAVIDDAVPEDWTKASAPDVGPEVRRLHDKSVDCAIAWISQEAGARIALTVQTMKYPLTILGPDTLSSIPRYVQLAKSAANGTVSVQISALLKPNAKQKVFRAAYAKKTKTTQAPSSYAMESYDAVYVLAKAIAIAKSADPAKVRDALEKVKNFPGAAGPVTFTAAQHEAVTPKQLTFVVYRNGKWSPTS